MENKIWQAGFIIETADDSLFAYPIKLKRFEKSIRDGYDADSKLIVHPNMLDTDVSVFITATAQNSHDALTKCALHLWNGFDALSHNDEVQVKAARIAVLSMCVQPTGNINDEGIDRLWHSMSDITDEMRLLEDQRNFFAELTAPSDLS